MSYIDGVLAKVFGTKNEREVKAMLPTVAAISALEEGTRQLSDIDLAAKTIEFKEQSLKAPPWTTS
jgi:preprotein translocase subunit SecA